MEKYLCEFDNYLSIGNTLEEAFDDLDADRQIPNISDCNFYKLTPIKVKLTEYE